WTEVGDTEEALRHVGPSVARDARIDDARPGVDAAGHVEEVAPPLTRVVLGGGLAADAVVAVEGDLRVLRQLLERGLALVVEQDGSLDLGRRALLLGADVEEVHLLPRAHPRLQLGDAERLRARGRAGV